MGNPQEKHLAYVILEEKLKDRRRTSLKINTGVTSKRGGNQPGIRKHPGKNVFCLGEKERGRGDKYKLKEGGAQLLRRTADV